MPLWCIFYDDDIVLLCGSTVGLQCMINLCVAHGKLFGVTFNHLKTNCMAFHHTKNSFCPSTNLNLNDHNLD